MPLLDGNGNEGEVGRVDRSEKPLEKVGLGDRFLCFLRSESTEYNILRTVHNFNAVLTHHFFSGDLLDENSEDILVFHVKPVFRHCHQFEVATFFWPLHLMNHLVLA